MDVRYVKTEAGKAELKERRLALPRQARLLLVIVDGSKSGAEWVAAVKGSSRSDLDRLCEAGLIAVQSKAPFAAAPTAAPFGGSEGGTGSGAYNASTPIPAAPGLNEAELAEVVRSLSPRQLRDLLTSQARNRLGLISGYRFVLEVERCTGAEEVRALALRFVDSVRQAQGAEGVRQVCVDLRTLATAAVT